MRYEPRGSAVRSFRTRIVETVDGVDHIRKAAQAGFIVRLADVAGQRPKDVRRAFVRFCRQNEIHIGETTLDKDTPRERTLLGCEFAEQTFSRRTGNAHDDTAEVATAYQVMGEPGALMALLEHYTIGDAHPALNVRVPLIAGGTTPTEFIRPKHTPKHRPKPIVYASTSKDLLDKLGHQPTADTKPKLDDYSVGHGFTPIS